jgi:beta-lactamase class A
MKKVLWLIFLPVMLLAQEIKVPEYYVEDQEISDSLVRYVKDLGLLKDFNVGDDGVEQISLAVIDMNGLQPHIGGVNPENFIYPASVYKMYVAMEILNQVYSGKYRLNSLYPVIPHNAVDGVAEILCDPRPLLKANDTVTVNYLLDLMITRSDNSAANCLIDRAGRPAINETISSMGWQGSEVTRKYLKRKFEDEGYAAVRGTETCALHAADYMYRVFTNKLINPWVSQQMKALLGRQLDQTKLASGLPRGVMYYGKTGWFSYWTNDVCIIDDGNVHYIVACFLPVPEKDALPKMKALSAKIYSYMKHRASK